MKLFFETDYEKMSRRAAGIIAAQVINRPKSVLGLATGSSPLGIYKLLAGWNRAGELDFSKVTTVNLDEYYGLEPTHEQSYRRFMNDNLFNKINIDKARTFVPDGMAKDFEKECADYDGLIEALGGIDLQLLGIGYNGHIGFNEPGDSFEAATHRVKLTESTMAANSRFFPDGGMPEYALTMGMRAIMGARKILLIAGAEKAEIIERAVKGPVTPAVPASLLQLHPDVTIVTAAK